MLYTFLGLFFGSILLTYWITNFRNNGPYAEIICVILGAFMGTCIGFGFGYGANLLIHEYVV